MAKEKEKVQPHKKLVRVMQRAAQLDLSELIETRIERGLGKRASPEMAVNARGKQVAIVDYSPEYPYSAIDWSLSNKTHPRKKLVVKRIRRVFTEWCFAIDVSATMRFATKIDTKVVTGTVVATSLAQAASKKKDRLRHYIFDECGIISTLEETTPEDMVLDAVKQDGKRKRSSGRMGKCRVGRSGISSFVDNLPDAQSILVVVSDFLHMTEADKMRLARASAYHHLFCVVVEDPREIEFPENVSGQITVRDIDTGRMRTMSFAEAHKLISADRQKRLDEFKKFCQKAHCQYAVFRSDESTASMRKKIMRLISFGA
jgi:uncharacterized protein (DUF58 family)